MVEDVSLTKAWDKFPIDFPCCHEQLGVSHVSILDHFFWNEQLEGSVVEAVVLHLPDNSSDHSPIYCIINFTNVHQVDSTPPVQHKAKPSWKKAKLEEKDNYRKVLEEQISNLKVPDSLKQCTDVKCKDPTHKEELDNFTMDLLETMHNVAE